MTLTDRDRHIIAQAREVAGLGGIASIREREETDSTEVALAHVYGEARYLLGELAAIAERLGADGA